MAARAEILTNILRLDPGMQLSRKVGKQLPFIPRIKLDPSSNADPRNRHDGLGHTCMRKEPISLDGQGRSGRRAHRKLQVAVAVGRKWACGKQM